GPVKRAIGRGVPRGRVQRESLERGAPPLLHGALLGGPHGLIEAPRFDQIAHALPRDPRVVGPRVAGAVQPRDEPVASGYDRDRRRRRVGFLLVVPIAVPPDALLARHVLRGPAPRGQPGAAVALELLERVSQRLDRRRRRRWRRRPHVDYLRRYGRR